MAASRRRVLHHRATSAFVAEVRDFTRVLEARRSNVERYLAIVRAPAPEAPPVVRDALELLEEQHEELGVANEELRAQIEALEEAVEAATRDRQRYRELFDAVPDAMLVVDTSGLVHSTNPAADALFDADAASLRGRSLASFAASTENGRLRELLEATVGSTEIALARASGAPFTARVICTPLEGGDRTLVVVRRIETGSDPPRDATQLARALRDKEDLLQRERAIRERLERTNDAKDRLIACVSHDLRGPINAVLGWTRIMRTEHLPRETRVRALETVERSTRTQLALVEQLLDLSRLAADKLRLELRPIDLRACTRHVTESLMPAAADAGVQLAAELCEHPARVFADRERIIQVLTNLISNAIKFTPRGGHARVRVRCEPPNAVLEVEDDGHGIDSATMPLLFEPYRQGTERARAGLGLGLYIVRRLVDLHGGTVEVSSEGRDRGARLTVRLPLAPEEGNLASSGTVAAEDSEPDLEAVRVLVVDDDADSRDLFATVFASRGATVLSAGSAEQALAMLESCAADIVVSDLDMPGEDGFTLMRRIRANAPDLPAIAVSALASKNDAERARDAGYDLHLAKPVEAAELIARVSELASKRRDG